MIIAWLLLSVLVGFIGAGRNIGFFGAFILSLILSALIGGIITLASTSKATATMASEAKKTDRGLAEFARQKHTGATARPGSATGRRHNYRRGIQCREIQGFRVIRHCICTITPYISRLPAGIVREK